MTVSKKRKPCSFCYKAGLFVVFSHSCGVGRVEDYKSGKERDIFNSRCRDEVLRGVDGLSGGGVGGGGSHLGQEVVQI